MFSLTEPRRFTKIKKEQEQGARSVYLDKEKLRRGAAGTKLRLIGAIVLTAFFALATFWGLIDYEGLRSGLDVYAAFLALGLVLLTLSVTAHRRLGSAQAYAAAFSGSRKADLPLTELAENLRKNSATVEKELRWLLKKGYLTDCRLAMDTVPRIVLDKVPDPDADYVTVECPHCGAGVRLRKGRSGKCEYCGGQVSDQESGRI